MDNKDIPVLITGASRGIGETIARTFAREGHPLYLCCKKNTDALKKLSDELIRDHGIICLPIPCDVGNKNDVENLFKTIEQSGQGYPMIVVNNAGVAHYGLLSDMKYEEWSSLMSTNLDSVFFICKNAIPHMLHKEPAKIINISSVWGNVGASCEVAYSASKGAVNALTKALAKELAPSGIQVNAIACGAIDTAMNSSHLTEEELSELASEIPADRLGTTEEVAALALQLAHSPSYLTGQIITLDGGWI